MFLFVFWGSDEWRRAARSSLHFLLAAEEGRERLTLTRKWSTSYQKLDQGLGDPSLRYWEWCIYVCVCFFSVESLTAWCHTHTGHSVNKSVCVHYWDLLWEMRQVSQFNSKYELMGDEHYSCLNIAQGLGSKQTLLWVEFSVSSKA